MNPIRRTFLTAGSLAAATSLVLLGGCQGGGNYGTEGARRAANYLPTVDARANPQSDAISNDGLAGDVRARSENLFDGEADEYLIIQRADGTEQRYGPDRIAALRARIGDGDDAQNVPLPLERTDIAGDVTLNLASVTVTQHFHNPYGSKIEAVYVFPLPQDAAVSDFVMQIGERRIRGVVREREEARELYEAARAAGYHASLLSQERPNVFTQSVANIEPGERIDVATTYFQTLPWRDGAFEMVIPTVVGPRFNPPGSEGGIGAVPPGLTGASGQSTEVAYVRNGDGPPHLLGLEVTLGGSLPLTAIHCDSHPVDIEQQSPTAARIALRHDEVPNRDFVLRFTPAGDDLRGAVAVHRDPNSAEDAGWFTMLIQPPLAAADVEALPREMVFVIDCSGSMNGEPLAVCKRTIRRCLDRLRPDDTIRLIRFSDDSSTGLGGGALAATPANLRRARAWLDDLDADGGTMMERGIRAALRPEEDPSHRRIVTFLTDGYIGNETDILRVVHEQVGAARIFSFGIGSAPNRYLLERMAVIGRGVAAYVDEAGSGLDQVDALFRQLENPALADLRIDWQGARVFGVEPQLLPDVFLDRPLIVHGRIKGELPRSIRLTGRQGTQARAFELPVGDARGHQAVPKLWARARIRSLADAMAWSPSPEEQAGMILDLALEYGLTSAYTSFLAIDASEVTDGDHGTTVTVPAAMPRGVRYDTTVSGQR